MNTTLADNLLDPSEIEKRKKFKTHTYSELQHSKVAHAKEPQQLDPEVHIN